MKEYRFRIRGKDYTVSIDRIEGGTADVTVNGTAYSVEMEGGSEKQVCPAPSAAADPLEVRVQSRPAAPASPARAVKSSSSASAVSSPLPGVIISVNVKEGDVVRRGQKIAVIEAMKMENDIMAPKDGTVTAVKVAKGDSVLEGAPIAEIA